MKKALILLLTMAIFTISAANADGIWSVFKETDVPEQLGFVVSEAEGDITLTFLGDCTLGGANQSSHSFAAVVEKNGLDYPFAGLTGLTLTDDITVANLEGVLSDRSLKKEKKTYNFIGKTDYTRVLLLGGVDAVTVANNHTYDYGAEGYHDTLTALADAQIAYFGTDRLAVWQSGAVMIGFVGVTSVSGKSGKAFERQVLLLRELGCTAVIAYMHAGVEYDSKPSNGQKAIAKKAARLGCTMLIGSHPHVVQGYAQVDGLPLFYSLGNCVFGGNVNPKDKDALAVQATLHINESSVTSIDFRLYPLSVSGEKNSNNYSPVLLSGSDAARIIGKMEKSTGTPIPEFEDGSIGFSIQTIISKETLIK